LSGRTPRNRGPDKRAACSGRPFFVLTADGK
jgi:hypothetical protein